MASIYFLPSAETVQAGGIFNVAVKVSSADQAMNAVSGDVSFSGDELRVLSISKGNSIVNLWVNEPSFSNAAAGDVHFEGVVLNPGYIGTGGTVIQITFQVVGSTGDSPSLAFSTASILANDGNGTNILDSQGTAQLTITPAVAPQQVALPAEPATPVAIPASTTQTVSTTTQPAVPAHIVTIEVPPGEDPGLLFVWGLVAWLALSWLVTIIVAIIYELRHRHRHMTKEVREDLKHIEKQLDADRPRSEIRREVERLEKDIKG